MKHTYIFILFKIEKLSLKRLPRKKKKIAKLNKKKKKSKFTYRKRLKRSPPLFHACPPCINEVHA